MPTSCDMRILVGTHHLQTYGGTETYVLTLAPHLAERGHHVTCYAPFTGQSAKDLIELGLDVVSDVDDLRKKVFDVAHVHHNVIAVQIRSALPNVPIVWLKHGTFPWLEQPPPFEPEIALAVSEDTAAQLRDECGLEVTVVPNPIDVDHFSPRRPIGGRPRSAVAVTNHLIPHIREIIWAACESLDISVRHVGYPEAPARDVRDVLEDSDIVFAVGRTALEAASMGRAVLIIDQHGFDGWLDVESYETAALCGFSGRALGMMPGPEELAAVIREGYDPKRALEAQKLVVENHSTRVVIPLLEEMYRKARLRGLAGGPLPIPRLGVDLAGLLTAYQHELRDARDHIGAIEERVTDNEARVEQLREETRAAQEREEAARHRVEEMEMSTSWRITSPARAVSGFLRRTASKFGRR